MTNISQHNNKQDQRLSKLEQRVDDWFIIFDKFVQNDFLHLKKLVYWLIGLSVGGLLIPIFIKVFF